MTEKMEASKVGRAEIDARELAERVIRDNGPLDRSDEGVLARALLETVDALAEELAWDFGGPGAERIAGLQHLAKAQYEARAAAENALRSIAATYDRWAKTPGHVDWRDVAAKMAYNARHALSTRDSGALLDSSSPVSPEQEQQP